LGLLRKDEDGSLLGLNDKAIDLEKKSAKNSSAGGFERVREHPYKKDGIRLLTIKKDWKVELVGLLH
jgi:hypothetical protein